MSSDPEVLVPDLIPFPDLVAEVRSALSHLYDHVYLQNHQLAVLVDRSDSLDKVTRAQKLRRLLLDCIEALRPQMQPEALSDAARAHAILTYRFVDGLDMATIAQKRGLGERQAYRELEKGVEAVAGILRDRLARELNSAASSAAPLSEVDQVRAAQAEVRRLSQARQVDTVDLRDLLKGLHSLLVPAYGNRGVQIQLDDAVALPTLTTDRVILRQALLGLITLGLESGGCGPLHVSATVEQHRVRIDIVALDADEATAPEGVTDNNEVQISRLLLESIGGRLVVQRTAGHWHARVWLSLARRASILVIDDNPDLISLLQRYSAGHDIEVIGAVHAEQGIRLADELQPRLILLDVMMPRLDGWEVLQRIRNQPSTADIPVVICSVVNQPELARSMGASGYLTKPVSQDDLIQILRSQIGPLRPLA